MIFTGFIIFWLMCIWYAYFFVAYRPKSVANKVILITGGGSGIGRLMAIGFAKKGARIVLWDVNKDGLKETQDTIIKAGGQCTTYVVDVTKRELVYQTAKEVGRINVLINNAGIVTGKPFLECPDELMIKTMEVNTISHFWTIKAFLPAMLEANEGSVVTIASAAGLCGVAGLVDYCASKFGAVGIAESLYMELKKRKGCKVTSTVICPYYINTGMFDGVTTRFPLLLPILEQDYAANRIITAVEREEESVAMPWLVNTSFPSKLLPVPWQYAIAHFLGLDAGMDAFKGRGGNSASKKKQ